MITKKIVLVTSLLLLTSQAFAYIDPGTNSFLIQMLLGGTAGLILFFKTAFQKIKIRKKADKKKISEDEEKEFKPSENKK